MGRPCEFENSIDGFEKFKSATDFYLLEVAKGNRQANMEQWADALNVTRQTLYYYCKRGEQWQGFIKAVTYKLAVERVKALPTSTI